MITASLHRSPSSALVRGRAHNGAPTGPARLGQTAARCDGELSAQVGRLYGDSRLITRSLFMTVFHGHLFWSLDAMAHDPTSISTSISIWSLDAVAHDLDVLIGQPLEDGRVVRRAALGRQLWGRRDARRGERVHARQGRISSSSQGARRGERPRAPLRSFASEATRGNHRHSEAVRRNPRQSPCAPLRSSASPPP